MKSALSAILVSLIWSILIKALEATMASPIPFELFDDDGTSLGNVTVRGGDINSWIEDENGYTICTADRKGVRSRHLKKGRTYTKGRQHTDAHTGVTAATSSNSTTIFFYCLQTEGGDIVPNHDYPVAYTDPDSIPNDILPQHVHRSEVKAVELCGAYCEMELTRGGARKLNRKLGSAPTSGNVPNLVVIFKFSDHASRDVPSVDDIEILMNSEVPVSGIAPTSGVKKVFLDNS